MSLDEVEVDFDDLVEAFNQLDVASEPEGDEEVAVQSEDKNEEEYRGEEDEEEEEETDNHDSAHLEDQQEIEDRHKAQLDLSERLQLLYILQISAGKLNPHFPSIHSSSTNRSTLSHYLLQQTLALFLSLEARDDEVAVTSVRTDTATRFLAAKSKVLTASDITAADSLVSALQDPTRTQASIRTIVLRNCYMKINRCLTELYGTLISRKEFSAAIDGYRNSSSRIASQVISAPSASSDKSRNGLQKFMQEKGLSDPFSGIERLYDSVRSIIPRAFLSIPRPLERGELPELDELWSSLLNHVVLLVQSDFFERMTRPEEITEAYTAASSEKLAKLRHALFRIAQYPIGVDTCLELGERDPQLGEELSIEWVMELTELTNPAECAVRVNLSKSPLEAARRHISDLGMSITNDTRLSTLFENLSEPSWKRNVMLAAHPEVKLICHLVAQERHLERYSRHPQAICCSSPSCWTCQLFVTAFNSLLTYRQTEVVLVGPVSEAIGENDLQWRYSGQEHYDEALRDAIYEMLVEAFEKAELARHNSPSLQTLEIPLGSLSEGEAEKPLSENENENDWSLSEDELTWASKQLPEPLEVPTKSLNDGEADSSSRENKSGNEWEDDVTWALRHSQSH